MVFFLKLCQSALRLPGRRTLDGRKAGYLARMLHFLV
jgi:hypothetical protein